MSKSKFSKRRGRPLQGEVKRERVSFTLNPLDIAWLEEAANEKNLNKSQVLDEIIRQARTKEIPLEKLNLPSVLRRESVNTSLKSFCKANRIKNLRLFGSALTKSFSPDSDIDLLVEFQDDFHPTLFDITAMEMELSKILEGRNIDLRTSEDLSRYFREDVKKRALSIYG
jgi:uncharacterized protein